VVLHCEDWLVFAFELNGMHMWLAIKVDTL